MSLFQITKGDVVIRLIGLGLVPRALVDSRFDASNEILGLRQERVHAYRPQNGALVVSDETKTGKWSRPPAFEQGDAVP